jgi:type I restriction enzyme S subunit
MMELGKILTYQKGKSPQRVHSSDIQVLYLTPEYLRGKSVPQFIEDFPNKVEVENGDLLLLWDGSNAGEVFRGKKGVLSSTMVKFDFDSLRYHRTFLFYQLKGFEGYLKSQTNGSGIPHVDRELLLGLKIQLFTEVEQTKIANILSTADEAIAQTEQLIAKYQRIKTGLMQDLLTKGIDEHGNIRNKTTHKFVVKNGVEVPEEWEVESHFKINIRN